MLPTQAISDGEESEAARRRLPVELRPTARRKLDQLDAIVKGRRGVTPDTALRLERATGMDADFWLDLQTRWGLWHALRSPAARELDAIERLPAT